MQNSNWTLRFPRTSREAFGYSVQFHNSIDDWEWIIKAGFLVFIGFMLGMALV